MLSNKQIKRTKKCGLFASLHFSPQFLAHYLGVSTLFMIDDISVSINFSGDKFSPTKAENVTGLIFSDKIEYGDIGIRGKYKGIAVPYGSGTLKVSKDIDMNDRILWLTEALSGKIEALRTLGSDEPHIYIGYFYKDQCNLTLTKTEIAAISELNLEFCFSCYDISDGE
jgi:hypothetical protein